MARRIKMRVPNYLAGEHERWDVALCEWTIAFRYDKQRDPTLEERQWFVNEFIRKNPKTFNEPVTCLYCRDFIDTLRRDRTLWESHMNNVRRIMQDMGMWKPATNQRRQVRDPIPFGT